MELRNGLLKASHSLNSRVKLMHPGVSISFCTSGYLRVTGGYICRRPENFEVLDSRRCIFRSFFVALLFHFFAPKSTNLNKFEENYVTMK